MVGLHDRRWFGRYQARPLSDAYGWERVLPGRSEQHLHNPSAGSGHRFAPYPRSLAIPSAVKAEVSSSMPVSPGSAIEAPF